MVGPTIQEELIYTIISFRLHNIVLTADLQKMFRQIKVNKSDTVYQKILWRKNQNEPVKVFQLDTVTQGTASAPFLAARTLHQLAVDEGSKFPRAAKVLKNDFYVDDLLTGATNIREAKKLKQELINILKLGSFELHKWASNKAELIKDSNAAETSEKICLDAETKKVLGIYWDPNMDTIMYTVTPLPTENRCTKRIILSEIAQLFDPLGLLGPVIIVAKLLMQEIWKAKLDWDETVPQLIYTKWEQFKKDLQLLTDFKINRQIILENSYKYELHGFCDSSEHAYGACIYLKSVDKYNNSSVHLICAKSRVAPLKTLSIPRLELCAALLLSNLIKNVSLKMRLKYNAIYMWSDSTIVLHWIKTAPHLLKTIVANRVAEIQQLTNINNWNHVATEDNPADFISRGQVSSQFINNLHWLHGPSWLVEDESKWKVKPLINVEIPEQRTKTALIVSNQSNTFNQNKSKILSNEIFERFSSIVRLKRFVALCSRVALNKTFKGNAGTYSTEELHNAHLKIIRVTQQNHFSKEIDSLKRNNNISSKSKLFSLNF